MATVTALLEKNGPEEGNPAVSGPLMVAHRYLLRLRRVLLVRMHGSGILGLEGRELPGAVLLQVLARTVLATCVECLLRLQLSVRCVQSLLTLAHWRLDCHLTGVVGAEK